MLRNSIIFLLVISRISFIISSSLCLIIHMQTTMSFSYRRLRFFSDFAEPLSSNHIERCFGSWILITAYRNVSTRTRENGSIETPVDGWKFRVERIRAVYRLRTLFAPSPSSRTPPFLAWFIDRSTTLEATSRESSRHVGTYRRVLWNETHVAQVSRDIQGFSCPPDIMHDS